MGCCGCFDGGCHAFVQTYPCPYFVCANFARLWWEYEMVPSAPRVSACVGCACGLTCCGLYALRRRMARVHGISESAGRACLCVTLGSAVFGANCCELYETGRAHGKMGGSLARFFGKCCCSAGPDAKRRQQQIADSLGQPFRLDVVYRNAHTKAKNTLPVEFGNIQERDDVEHFPRLFTLADVRHRLGAELKVHARQVRLARPRVCCCSGFPLHGDKQLFKYGLAHGSQLSMPSPCEFVACSLLDCTCGGVAGTARGVATILAAVPAMDFQLLHTGFVGIFSPLRHVARCCQYASPCSRCFRPDLPEPFSMPGALDFALRTGDGVAIKAEEERRAAAIQVGAKKKAARKAVTDRKSNVKIVPGSKLMRKFGLKISYEAPSSTSAGQRQTFTLSGQQPQIVIGAVAGTPGPGAPDIRKAVAARPETPRTQMKRAQAANIDVKLPTGMKGVGSRHAIITFDEDSFFYTHLCNFDKTTSRLNGRPVTGGKRSPSRLYSGDVLNIGDAGLQISFTTDHESIYWREYDGVIGSLGGVEQSGQGAPAMVSMERDWGDSLANGAAGLFAGSKSAEAVNRFKRKGALTPYQQEVQRQEALRKRRAEQAALERQRLEEERQRKQQEAAARRMAAERERLRALRQRVRDVNRRVVEAGAVKGAMDAALAERARLEAEAEAARQSMLAAEEARRRAEAKAAVARSRLLKSGKIIVDTNRMKSALDILRAAQAEKARLEAEEKERIEAARQAELARVRRETRSASAKLQEAIDSGDYQALQRALDDVDANEPAVLEALQAKIAVTKQKLEEVASTMSVAERQECEKERIETARLSLKALREAEPVDTESHGRLARELMACRHDVVLATAPQLQEEFKLCQTLIDERQAAQQKLIDDLEKALASDDTDVGKKLRRVQKAKAALDAHVPGLDEAEAELIELRTGKVLRKLAVLEQLRKLIAKLNNRTIAELKSYRTPDPDVVSCMRATYTLLGEATANLEDWKAIKTLIGKTGKLGLKRRITLFSLSTDVTEENADVALNELLMIKDVDAIHTKSKGAAVFYAWCKGILDEWKEDQEVAKAQEKVARSKSASKLTRSRTAVAL